MGTNTITAPVSDQFLKSAKTTEFLLGLTVWVLSLRLEELRHQALLKKVENEKNKQGSICPATRFDSLHHSLTGMWVQ